MCSCHSLVEFQIPSVMSRAEIEMTKLPVKLGPTTGVTRVPTKTNVGSCNPQLATVDYLHLLKLITVTAARSFIDCC